MKQIQYFGHKNIIAARLKALRAAKGLSQTDLAAQMQVLGANVDQQMISKIEKDQRQVTDYEAACFCRCLGVAPNELLSDCPFPTP